MIDLNIEGANEYTYAQLSALVSSNALIPGKKYILTDYYTSYRQPISNHYIRSFFTRSGGVVVGQAFSSSASATVAGCAGDDSYLSGIAAGTYGEKLMLTAMSSNSFAPETYSLDFPMDIVEYRFSMNTREGDSSPRPGLIVRRKDTNNNIDIPGDWRTQVWARFKALKSSIDGGAETDRVRDWASGTSEKGFYYWDADETGNSDIKRIRRALKASASSWDYASFVTVIPNIDAFALAVNGANNLKIDTSSVAYRYTFDGRWEKYDVTTNDGTYGDRDINGQNCSVSNTPLCRIPNNPGRDITGGDPNAYIYNVIINGGSSDYRHNNVIYQETTRSGYNISAEPGFYSNTFGSNCPSNTFGSNCYGNTFGSSCSSNTFGSNCYGNVTGGYTWQYVDARAGSIQNYTETANRSRVTRTSAGAWA